MPAPFSLSRSLASTTPGHPIPTAPPAQPGWANSILVLLSEKEKKEEGMCLRGRKEVI